MSAVSGVKPFVAPVLGVLLLGGALAFVRRDVSAASKRLANPETAQETNAATAASASAAVADDAEAPYCTPQFKGVLQRVLHACGLVGGQERRGCQPADVKSFASISDDDVLANAFCTTAIMISRGAMNWL